MWERFSYYGMRALFCFLTSSLQKGLAWSIEDAMALYGTYTMWVYFTPVLRILGGSLLRVSLGCCASALAMTLGHASMAVETPCFLYIELGSYYRNGLFKPNMTSLFRTPIIIILRKRRCLFNVLYGCECRCFFRDYVVWVYW
jgi:POT family proton-dependent oligopeptide transporter